MTQSMRELAAFFGSLAVGILLTASGLAFDLITLVVAGIGLLAVAGILWLVHWRTHVDGRIYLELNITPEFLAGLYNGRTRVQAEKAIGIYLGKWIRVSGTLHDVEIESSSGTVVTFAQQTPAIVMRFRKGVRKLEVLQKGDFLNIQGQIAALDPNWVRLDRCELLSVGEGAPTHSKARADLPGRDPKPASRENSPDFDWSHVANLTPGQVEDLMEGCADRTIAGLRVIAEHGPVIRANLLYQAGIENYGHFQGRVTQRTRTITGDRNAFLFTWDDWQSEENERSGGIGHYAVTATTFRSLRIYFNLD